MSIDTHKARVRGFGRDKAQSRQRDPKNAQCIHPTRSGRSSFDSHLQLRGLCTPVSRARAKPRRDEATAAASQSIQRSREHIVGSDEVRARWLLDFAFRDLKLLSPGDWLNLFTELQAFLSSRGFVYGRIAHDEIERAVLEPEVRRVQKWLRSSLMRLVLNEGSTWRIEPKVSFNFIFHRDQGLTDWSFPGGASAVQDLFRFRAYETLRSQAHRFRSCLECRRPFIVRKRQEYCSVRCSQTLRTRKFRSKRPKRKRS